MLPALKLFQHWRGSKHTLVCKATYDTHGPAVKRIALLQEALPDSFPGCAQREKKSQKQARAILFRGRQAMSYFLKRKLYYSKEDLQEIIH